MSSKHIINKQPPVYDVILIFQSMLVNLAIVRGKWRALQSACNGSLAQPQAGIGMLQRKIELLTTKDRSSL